LIPRESVIENAGVKRQKRECAPCLDHAGVDVSVPPAVLAIETVAEEDCAKKEAVDPAVLAVKTVAEEDSAKKEALEVGTEEEMVDKLLEDVSRQQRERKAVKADDAAVPEYLWEEHLREGSGMSEWDKKAVHDLRTVSSWLRERMLCWWKRKVVSSYVKWMKEKYVIEEWMVDRTVKVNLAGGGDEWCGYGQDRYEWESGGRDFYRKWWKDRLVATIEDLIPASDAIARAAESSWWNWDDGSRPFHWRWPDHYQRVIRERVEGLFSTRTAPLSQGPTRCGGQGDKEKGGGKVGQSTKERIHCPWLCGITYGVF
jgi:hypothetical protein